MDRVVISVKKGTIKHTWITKSNIDEVPPPGSYNLGYFDLSRKISRYEDSDKKVAPFNTSSLRFKDKVPESYSKKWFYFS